MEKIQDLSAYVAVNVRGYPAGLHYIKPAVDPRAAQVEQAIREMLARGLVR